MTVQQYPLVASLDSLEERQHRREMTSVINLTSKGKLNCMTEVTLSGNATTELIDERIHKDCFLAFDPLDNIAEEIIRNGPFRVNETDRSTGRLVITHATDVAGARFKVIIIA
jgi:hypothetical protein